MNAKRSFLKPDWTRDKREVVIPGAVCDSAQSFSPTLVYMIERTKSQTTAVQNSFCAQDYGDGECWRIALLRQGSVIAFSAMTREVVPQTKCLEMHS